MRNKMIRKYVCTIVFTSFFLVFATCFCYLPSKERLATSLSFLESFEKVMLQGVSDSLTLAKAYPISDEEGLETEAFIFKIQNNSDTISEFKVLFTPGKGKEFISPTSINYVIGDENGYKQVETLTEEGIILNDTLEKNTNKTYYLKFWIKEDLIEDLSGKYFQGTLELKNS